MKCETQTDAHNIAVVHELIRRARRAINQALDALVSEERKPAVTEMLTDCAEYSDSFAGKVSNAILELM